MLSQSTKSALFGQQFGGDDGWILAENNGGFGLVKIIGGDFIL